MSTEAGQLQSTNDYYAADALGSTMALTASNGTTDDATYTYDPYGAVTSSGALAGTNPWQYAGGYSTQSLSVEKFGDRYYNAGLQRWTQLDPQGGGFAYVGDDPVNLTDPTGRVPLCPTGDWVTVGNVCPFPYLGIRLIEVALTLRASGVSWSRIGNLLAGVIGFVGYEVVSCLEKAPVGAYAGLYLGKGNPYVVAGGAIAACAGGAASEPGTP